MSNKLQNLIDTRRVGSLARKAVLRQLANRASDDGTGIWPSKTTLADELGTDRKTVVRQINGLMADGLVKKVGERSCQQGYTDEYDIDVAAIEALPLTPSAARKAGRSVVQSHTSAGRSGVQDHTRTDRTDTSVVESHTTRGSEPHEPSMNHTSPSEAKASSVDGAARPAENEVVGGSRRSTGVGGRRPTVNRHDAATRARTTVDTQPSTFQSDCVEWSRREMKWNRSDAEAEFERFRDNALARGRQYSDWLAAWRNWCRSPYCTTQPEDDPFSYGEVEGIRRPKGGPRPPPDLVLVPVAE